MTDQIELNKLIETTNAYLDSAVILNHEVHTRSTAENSFIQSISSSANGDHRKMEKKLSFGSYHEDDMRLIFLLSRSNKFLGKMIPMQTEHK